MLESLHRKRIGRTFAIAAKPVTVGEYRRFNKSYTFIERFAPTPDCPVVYTSWYQAAAYGNWLSDQEGISPGQWCYKTNKGQVSKLKANYLSLAGYRLPTEAEIEYSCRAGALTSRYYGGTEELMGKYGWFVQNSGDCSWPVGSKKPNDFGLFDALGNVWCWCMEVYKAYPQGESGNVIDDKEYDLGIKRPKYPRVCRGGSFSYRASVVRSANRNYYVPTYRGLKLWFSCGEGLYRLVPLLLYLVPPKGVEIKKWENTFVHYPVGSPGVPQPNG